MKRDKYINIRKNVESRSVIQVSKSVTITDYKSEKNRLLVGTDICGDKLLGHTPSYT